jgi:hypothetical protein
MAYTTPDTAVTGVVAPAAMWNSGVRDNLLAMMHPVIVKAADETLASNTTLQDDNHLIFPVLANEEWQWELWLLLVGSNAADIKVAFTFPTGGTFSGSFIGSNDADVLVHRDFGATTSPTPTWAIGIQATSAPPLLQVIRGRYLNGANAGNLTLQWAQNTSNATATNVKAGSTWWGANRS